MRQNILNSPHLSELKKGRRRVFLSKILLYVFALAAIFAGSSFISRIPSLNISEVKITGNKVIDTDKVKATVEKEIAGNYLWFFPKTNIFFYPKNNIKNKLFDEFKILNDVTLSNKDRKTLEISVTEREAKYLWCGDQLVVGAPSGNNKDGKCNFVDENGYVFDVAPYFSGNVYFKFFGPLNGDYFSPEIFEKIVTFKDALNNMGFKPVALYIKDDDLPAQTGNIEIYLSSNILPPNSPKIILKNDFDLEKISENLQAAIDTEPLKTNLKNKYSAFQYIDLRFGNKVYYKFR